MRRLVVLSLSLVVVAVIGGCASGGGVDGSRLAAKADDSGATPPAFVTSRDEKTGAPTFLRAPSEASSGAAPNVPPSAEGAARFWLERHASRYGATPEALANAQVTQIHDLGRGGIIVLLRQQVNGVEVYGHDMKVMLDRAFNLVAIGGGPHPAAVAGRTRGRFQVAPGAALVAALEGLGPVGLQGAHVVQRGAPKDGWSSFDLAPGVSALQFTSPARVKSIYLPRGHELVAAWLVETMVERPGAADLEAYRQVLAAEDGALLLRQNLTQHQAYTYRVFADATGDKRPFDGPSGDFTPHPTGLPVGTPFPAFVAPNLVSMTSFNKTLDPWLPANATATTGNHVDAYTDDLNPVLFSAGDVRALLSSPGTFDYTFNTALGAQSSINQKMASVTNLFYVTNWMHNWWYDSGFNEAAGSAQTDNFGRGGMAGDAMQALAQAGAPTMRNNANMSTPSDGMPPQMRMFVWDGAGATSLVANGTSYPVGVAAFGPTTFSLTSTLVLADDGTATVTDACEALVNNVVGKVVLVDRGTCSFEKKVVNAQTASAIGVIVIDNVVAYAPPAMGDDATIATALTIGSLSVTQASGTALKTALMNGAVNVTLTRGTDVDRDSAIDNTIVAHEWAHYLHQRLVVCGNAQCSAMSEGWADLNALLMVLRPGDNLDGTYAIAQYAAQFLDPSGYFGIRRYPYSRDMTKNPLTFQHISDGVALPNTAPRLDTSPNNSQVHNAGEIWGQMLFDGLLALVAESQKVGPRYTFDQARRRMTDYIVGGMKLAPADPTYLEQRDAILTVAATADAADAALLTAAFTKRGAGSCAVGPARDSKDFKGVTEDFMVRGLVQVKSVTLDDSVTKCDSDGQLDAGERGKLTITVANPGSADWTGTVAVTTTATGVTFPAGAMASFNAVGPWQQRSATIDVAIDPTLVSRQSVTFTLTPSPAASCDGKTSVDLTFPTNYDVVAMSSKTDDVEAPTSTWTVGGTLGDKVWAREALSGVAHVWHGVDYGSPSDTWLASPALQVAASGSLTLTFEAKYRFEQSMGTNWDGAVIEVSADNGATWNDISMYATVPATFGTIGGASMNALKDRKGFVGSNAMYPAAETFTFDLGTTLAGKTVQVRFRLGSDDATGDFGLQLDNIAFGGITNTPFASLVDDQTACVPVVPDAGTDADAGTGTDAGMGGGKGGGCGCRTSSGGLGDAARGSVLLLLGLLAFRRLRSTQRRRAR